MALTVRTRDIRKIPGAVALYRVSAYITGVMLLLLIFEMIIKYTPLHLEMELGGNRGLFVPESTAGVKPGTVDLSILILIAHGWLYVLYLFADFRLWSIMRWKPMRFLWIALGGVIPGLSFFVEHHMAKIALATHAELVAEQRDKKAAAAAVAEKEEAAR
jgi:integral membrane protein